MKLLIVEDDTTYAAGLVRTLSRRGFSCLIANANQEALEICREHSPTHILLDLNLGNETTQELIPQLRLMLPQSKIVVLTGYGTIPSTVRAIKDGADQYLCKPATPETIENALRSEDKKEKSPPSLWDLEHEHIVQTLKECGGNITQAAKLLGLHRRTLQRKMKKI